MGAERVMDDDDGDERGSKAVVVSDMAGGEREGAAEAIVVYCTRYGVGRRGVLASVSMGTVQYGVLVGVEARWLWWLMPFRSNAGASFVADVWSPASM